MNRISHICVPENAKNQNALGRMILYIIKSAIIVGCNKKLFHVLVDEQLNTSQTGHLSNTKGVQS